MMTQCTRVLAMLMSTAAMAAAVDRSSSRGVAYVAAMTMSCSVVPMMTMMADADTATCPAIASLYDFADDDCRSTSVRASQR